MVFQMVFLAVLYVLLTDPDEMGKFWHLCFLCLQMLYLPILAHRITLVLAFEAFFNRKPLYGV